MNNITKNKFAWLHYAVLTLMVCGGFTASAAPRWTEQFPHGRNHVYTVGLGESPNSLSEARKAAIASAISGFNTTQGVTLRSKIILKKVEDSTSYRETVIDELEVQGVSSTLTGLQIEATYIGNYGSPYRMWALMSLPSEHTISYWSPVWRSALLPGWGQVYQGNTKRGVGFLIAEAVAVGGIFFTASEYSDSKSKANLSTNRITRDDYNRQANNYYSANVVCVCAAVAAYGLNLADVLFLTNNRADLYYSAVRIRGGTPANPAIAVAVTIPLSHH